MRNKRRPFFYREERKRIHPVIFLLLFLILLLLWGANVPMLRQIFAVRFVGVYTYVQSIFLPIHLPNPLDFRVQTFYSVPELPSEEALYATDLESLSKLKEEENLQIVVEETNVVEPTPIWVYAESTAQTNSDSSSMQITANAQLALPMLERQDYQNDASTVLALLLRMKGQTVNQYSVNTWLKPFYFSPPPSFADWSVAIQHRYPNYQPILRQNGDIRLVGNLLAANIPVVIRMETKNDQRQWESDDRWDLRYVLLVGIDFAAEQITFFDPALGKIASISWNELLRRWYSTGRAYFLLLSEPDVDVVQKILAGNWNENENMRLAKEKFLQDVSHIPENRFAWLNAAELIHLENMEEAWNMYRTALQIGVPQRYFIYNSSWYETAFEMGAADELTAYANAALRMNRFAKDALLWKGWANMLKENYAEAQSCFEKAAKYSPESKDVLYALTYLNQ